MEIIEPLVLDIKKKGKKKQEKYEDTEQIHYYTRIVTLI